jgi:hypothetical protein
LRKDVLDLYAEAPDQKHPVVYFGESSIRLIGEVAKKHGKLVGTGDRGKADCGSNDRLRFERPAGASAFGVKSIDLAITAPD